MPVHDEEDLLSDCLAALRTACRVGAGTGAEVGVTVVLDACSDRSPALVAAAAFRAVRVDAHNVGRARAAGFAAALTDPTGRWPQSDSLDDIWLATTDADSRVPPNWLTAQLAAARGGADMVLGTVTVEDWSNWSASTAERYAEEYGQPGPGGAHPHVHGANLGIRASVYREVGGFPPVPTGEDHALVAAVTAAGGRIARLRQGAGGHERAHRRPGAARIQPPPRAVERPGRRLSRSAAPGSGAANHPFSSDSELALEPAQTAEPPRESTEVTGIDAEPGEQILVLVGVDRVGQLLRRLIGLRVVTLAAEHVEKLALVELHGWSSGRS